MIGISAYKKQIALRNIQFFFVEDVVTASRANIGDFHTFVFVQKKRTSGTILRFCYDDVFVVTKKILDTINIHDIILA